MIGNVLKAMLVVCLVSSLAACAQKPPDRPDRGRVDPVFTVPRAGSTRGAGVSEHAESTAVESTVGGMVLRRDESVLRIDQAELLRSKGGDEVFVRATVKGPAEHKDCLLMKGSAWLANKRAIESGDPADLPAPPEAPWGGHSVSTEKFSSGDTLAVSFRHDAKREGEGPDPRDTPFFAMCFKDASAGDGTRTTTWYDAAHVKGTPKAS